LPIKPKYANQILSGNKTVEFRKRGFAKDIEYVAVYSSSPVSRVVGIFKISEINKDRPATIWKKFREVGGISHANYCKYYANSEQACALVIKSVTAFTSPLKLDQIRTGMKAPQSFCYLSEKELHSTARKGAGLPV
jgi:type I restriction enzyme S subunit